MYSSTDPSSKLAIRTGSLIMFTLVELITVAALILQPPLKIHLLLSVLCLAELVRWLSPFPQLSIFLPFPLQELLAHLPTLRFWHWLHLFLQ